MSTPAHIKENVFTRDTFFKRDESGFTAVNKKKKLHKKNTVDSTAMPSKNYGASRGSSQNACGDPARYRGEIKITTKLSALALVEYLRSLPYMMSGMDIVLQEKIMLWNPKGKNAEEMVKKIKSAPRFDGEDEKLAKEFVKWKK